MAQYNKSIETKSNILKVARTLFYEKGFTETTTRQIAEQSNSNLGLIKYHFGSKNEIAISIYSDIRTKFDEKIESYGYDTNPLKYYLFSCALEMYLCLENVAFGRFYREIVKEPSIVSHIHEIIITGMKHIIDTKFEPSYYTFSCISMSAMKPALTEYALSSKTNPFSTDSYIQFYLESILHFFKEDPSLCYEVMEEMKHYHINVVNNFTPILEKIIDK